MAKLGVHRLYNKDKNGKIIDEYRNGFPSLKKYFEFTKAGDQFYKLTMKTHPKRIRIINDHELLKMGAYKVVDRHGRMRISVPAEFVPLPKRKLPEIAKRLPIVSGLVPGDVFKDCKFCPEMVVIPAGSYLMGSPVTEKGRKKIEGPQRKVTFSNAFAVGKYEVTFEEWDMCVSLGGCQQRPDDRGWGRQRRPVINVSWKDAQEYISWLRTTGKNYRLLSEAEWEYSARAGTSTPYATGEIITKNQAQFDSDRTAPVGSFAANQFGLHDMHGNVWEWVEDCSWWQEDGWTELDYSNAPNDGSPVKSEQCRLNLYRGGSWNYLEVALRSAQRKSDYRSNHRFYDLGFRVGRSLDTSELKITKHPLQ